MKIWINEMGSLLGVLFGICIVLGLPALTIWGWFRWAKQRDLKQFCPIVAWLALLCATLSGLLILVSVVYVQSAPLKAYDIRWVRLLRIGLLSSAAAVLLSLLGIWQRSSLRWFAPACASGVLFLWVMFAAMD